MEMILSRANALIQRMAKLKDKKNRDKERLFPLEGIKLFEEMQSAKFFPRYAFATPAMASLLTSLPEKVEKYIVSESVYEKISSEKSPQGIFCAMEYLDKFHKIATIYSGAFQDPVLCLSEIQDPGNLGTILRTMRAFGCGTVILSDTCADLYSQKVIRASMGAIFAVPTIRTSAMAETITSLNKRGYRTCAATLDASAKSLPTLAPDEKTCFVIGNEGRGLSQEVISACKEKVVIPMSPGSESLNAAVAAAILLWEKFRVSHC